MTYTAETLIYQPKNLSVFFYIGEATSRLHWSLYDYFRATNKKLEKFNNQNSLIIFDNIYSTHTHTSPSLLDTLTIIQFALGCPIGLIYTGISPTLGVDIYIHCSATLSEPSTIGGI